MVIQQEIATSSQNPNHDSVSTSNPSIPIATHLPKSKFPKMEDFPEDLLREILSYVPAVLLLRFRCVCKAWRSLIDNDEDFIKLHLQHQTSNEYLFLETKASSPYTGPSVYALPLNSLDFSEIKSISVEATPIQSPIIYSRVLSCVSLACCDGLVLLLDFINNVWKLSLWNPSTREYMELPPSDDVERVGGDNVKRIGVPVAGLGYDNVSDDYKVVKLSRFCYNNVYQMETVVYSLKSNCWKHVVDSPNFYVIDSGYFVNGAMHWLISIRQQGQKKEEQFISFDLRTETYHQLSLPSGIYEPGKRTIKKYLSGTSACLFLCCNYYKRNCLDLWKMNECGGKYTWTKLFSPECIADARRIAYSANKEWILFRDFCYKFVWFNIKKDSAKIATINGWESFGFLVLPTTLVRLNRNRGVSRIFTLRMTREAKRKMAERLQITFTSTDLQLPLQ